MLTPVDIQQKKFHAGLGYDKKDVNSFFESVAESYEELYRSNAELKEQIISLTDELQNYKSKEDALQKSMMLAEKDSEDTKSRATREAKNIELDAKNKAKLIIGDAEDRLEEIEQEMASLETQYAAYKSNFASLLKMHFEFLEENDFDVDAHIDPSAMSLLTGAAPKNQGQGQAAFGEFSGDPQMRDPSLGGLGSGISTAMMGDDMKTSSSAMYGTNLSANDGFVDPFNPDKEQVGRYNPYDGRDTEKKASEKKKTTKSQTTQKKATSAKVDETKKAETKTEPVSQEKAEEKVAPQAEAKPETKAETTAEPKTEPKAEPKSDPIPEIKTEASARPEPEIINLSEDDDEDTLVGDVDLVETALLGDGETDENLDDFGFEYVEE